MPYTMNDYPSSLKNLNRLERKKAIDIINAMLDDGYDENKAIPIGTEQAQEWYENASEEDLAELENKYIQDDDSQGESRGAQLIDNDIAVYFEEDEWKVRTEGAEKPSKTFEYKNDAVDYAQEIADKRGTTVIEYKKSD